MTQRCIAGGIWSRTISPKSRSSAPSPRDTTRQSKASAPTSTLPLRSSPQGKCQQTLASEGFMNRERFVLSDTVWQKIEALLPGKKTDRGVTARDNRLFLEAVLWRVRAGLPWRDLPAEFGHWNSVFTRFRRWARAMVF